MNSRVVVATLILAMTGINPSSDDTSPFKITTNRSEDRIEVRSEGCTAVLVVGSPFGISSATIERTTEQWPETVVLQLRLKGLENFSMSTETLKLAASVSSQNADLRLWKDRKEDSPLDSKSPYWMEIQIIDSDGKPTKIIPLKDGYFELKLPKKFFEDNPKSFKLEWIDFYRN